MILWRYSLFSSLEPSDGKHPPSAIYRYYLNARSYERLVGTVARMRKARPAWDLLFFNCNAFTAKVARSIGLRAPSSLILPNHFIRRLYLMNGPPETRGAPQRQAPQRQSGLEFR